LEQVFGKIVLNLTSIGTSIWQNCPKSYQVFNNSLEHPLSDVKHHVHFRSLVGVTRVQRLLFSLRVFVAKVASNRSAEMQEYIWIRQTIKLDLMKQAVIVKSFRVLKLTLKPLLSKQFDGLVNMTLGFGIENINERNLFESI